MTGLRGWAMRHPHLRWELPLALALGALAALVLTANPTVVMGPVITLALIGLLVFAAVRRRFRLSGVSLLQLHQSGRGSRPSATAAAPR